MCNPITPNMLETTTMTLRSKGSGVDKYPAKAHAHRVADKLGLESGLIILKGEKSENFSNSDMPRPFRQDRYFYYLTGCNEPNCYVSYDIGRDKLTLWLPPVNLDRAFYDGQGSTPEEAMEKYDVDEAKHRRSKKKTERLGFILKQEFIKKDVPWMFNQFPRDIIKRKVWGEKVDKQRNFKLREAMNACRAVKDEHEIALLRKANAVSADAHTLVLKKLHGLKHETEVEAVYTAVCLAQGAKEQSYGPICGSGSNAGQLHYVANDCAFGSAGTLLIDAGAEWKCYASDVTRTLPLNADKPGHWASKEARQIYEAVAKIQNFCITRLKPGKKFIQVNWRAQHMVIEALLKLGILKGDHMEIFHAGTFLAFFPHGLGHHMGLEVHDVQPPAWNKKNDRNMLAHVENAAAEYAIWSKRFAPKYAATCVHTADSKPSARAYGFDPLKFMLPNTPKAPALEAGNVVTIEPGIYFNSFILDNFFLNEEKHTQFIDTEVLERYMHVGGVRIEDDILITKDGFENLTTTPKGKAALEIIRCAAEA